MIARTFLAQAKYKMRNDEFTAAFRACAPDASAIAESSAMMSRVYSPECMRCSCPSKKKKEKKLIIHSPSLPGISWRRRGYRGF